MGGKGRPSPLPLTDAKRSRASRVISIERGVQVSPANCHNDSSFLAREHFFPDRSHIGSHNVQKPHRKL